MEMTQYQKDLVRMWDSLRIENKGANNCHPIKCKLCPLETVCPKTSVHALFSIGEIIEVVTEWAKEHPVVTNEAKFKEDWGCEPKSIGGIYLCPSYFGFEECVSPFGQSVTNPYCIECEKKFWGSEYKPPKKEGE